jgi:putative transposase
MPRVARTVVTNVPYHVTQRGNRKQDIFFSSEDRKRYLEWLSLYSSVYKFDILAYCLMTNHVHVIGIPRKPDSMARIIQTVHMLHTQAVNREKGWSGHLWHSRYFSTALDEPYLWQAMRYVEQNPVRAGLVRKAEDYPWSSATYHCGLRVQDSILYEHDEYESMFDDWCSFLAKVPDDETLTILRRRTMTGIPCGDDRFIHRISKKVGYRIVERARGGQPKQVK